MNETEPTNETNMKALIRVVGACGDKQTIVGIVKELTIKNAAAGVIEKVEITFSTDQQGFGNLKSSKADVEFFMREQYAKKDKE